MALLVDQDAAVIKHLPRTKIHMKPLSPILKSPVFALLAIALLVGAPGFAQSQNAGFSVGDTLKPDQVHIITNPGRYGLGPAPGGSKYAVAQGKLIRINPDDLQVKSILRKQEMILD